MATFIILYINVLECVAQTEYRIKAADVEAVQESETRTEIE